MQTSKLQGETLLEATFAGNAKLVFQLLDEGCHPDFIGSELFPGLSPLHIATQEGTQRHLECAVSLLAKGANINILDSQQKTPLHYAVSQGNIDWINFLIGHSANVKNEGSDIFIYQRTSDLSVRTDNLVFDISQNGSTSEQHFCAKKGKQTGKWYYEALFQTPSIGYFGWSQGLFQEGELVGERWQAHQGWMNERWESGDVAGCFIDLDSSTAWFTKNGKKIDGSIEISDQSRKVIPTVSLSSFQKITVNMGATPFKFSAGDHEGLFESSNLYNSVIESALIQNNTSVDIKIQCVDLLLQKGSSINCKDWRGQTPMHVVAGLGDSHLLQYLISKGANIDPVDTNSMTPLHYAAKSDNPSCVELLIQKGADTNALDLNQRIPAHHAAFAGNRESLEILLLDKRNSSLDIYGYNLLHCAVQSNNPQLIKFLLEKQFSVVSTDRQQNTPMHIAARCSCIESIRVLIERGAPIDSQDRFHRTPLHVASCQSDVEVVRLLLSHGAFINHKSKFSLTPVFQSASHGVSNVLGFLLKQPNVEVLPNENRTSALHVVCRLGFLKCTELLLLHGVETNPFNSKGYTPLHEAVMNGCSDVVSLLLSMRADANLPSRSEQRTPLHFAAKSGSESCVRSLLSSNASINVVDKKGKRPIDYCESYPQIAMILLNKGALTNKQIKVEWSVPKIEGDHPPAFRGATFTPYQDKLILFGSGLVSDLISDLYFLDPSGDSSVVWTHITNSNGDVPSPRSFHGAAILDSLFFIFGGTDNEGKFLPLNHVYVLSLENYVWRRKETRGECPPKSIYWSSTQQDNIVWVFGGVDGENQISDSLYSLNLENLEWTKIPNEEKHRPVGRIAHSSEILDNKLFIISGQNTKSYIRDVDIFDIDLLQWLPTPTTQPIPPVITTSFVLPFDKKILCFGGRDEHGRLFNELWSLEWDQLQNSISWVQPRVNGKEIPSPRSSPACTLLNESFYVWGGMGELSNQKIVFDDLFCLSTNNSLLFSEDLRGMVNNKTFSDIEITVKEKEKTTKIPAHKILLEGSSFFRILLTKEENIVIDDFPVPVVEIILEFLYTNSVQPDLEITGLDLTLAAKKYFPESWEDFARAIMKDQPKQPLRLQHQLAKSFDSSLYSDFVFTFVDSQNSIKSHKIILSTRSQYFQLKFQSDAASNSEQITQWTFPAFHKLIQFLYTEDINIPFEISIELLQCSNFYNLPKLTQKCELVIQKNLNSSNVVALYCKFSDLKIEKLKSKCFSFILQNYERISRTKEFSLISDEKKNEFEKKRRIGSSIIVAVVDSAVQEKRIQEAVVSVPEKLKEIVQQKSEVVLEKVVESVVEKVYVPLITVTEAVQQPVESQSERKKFKIVTLQKDGKLAERKPKSTTAIEQKQPETKSPSSDGIQETNFRESVHIDKKETNIENSDVLAQESNYFFWASVVVVVSVGVIALGIHHNRNL